MNRTIVKQFVKLIDLLKTEYNLILDAKQQEINTYKVASLTKNCIAMSKMKNKIKSSSDVSGIPGFGKGTLSRIDEIIKTGKLEEIEELKNKHKKMIKINKLVEELKTVIGIGTVRAFSLINTYNIVSLNDLKIRVKSKSIKVNDKIKLGLKYSGKYINKIERSIITKIKSKFKKYITESNLKWMICGSYRRKVSHSSDIDLLVCNDDLITLEQVKSSTTLSSIIDKLKNKKFITDDITSSIVRSKYMGFCRFNGKLYRLDIRLVPKESWYTSISYFTGSFRHNIIMRNKAIKMMMKLNEYGLYNVMGKKVQINSEQDLFDKLKMKWLEPHER